MKLGRTHLIDAAILCAMLVVGLIAFGIIPPPWEWPEAITEMVSPGENLVIVYGEFTYWGTPDNLVLENVYIGFSVPRDEHEYYDFEGQGAYVLYYVGDDNVARVEVVGGKLIQLYGQRVEAPTTQAIVTTNSPIVAGYRFSELYPRERVVVLQRVWLPVESRATLADENGLAYAGFGKFDENNPEWISASITARLYFLDIPDDAPPDVFANPIVLEYYEREGDNAPINVNIHLFRSENIPSFYIPVQF